jgi:nitrous oxidase accessory protein NosD
MAEDALELHLRAAAAALDEHAPAFDTGRLRPAGRPPRRPIVALVCVLALVGVAAAPATISAIRDLFAVDVVAELGPLAPGVAPPMPGRTVSVAEARAYAPFAVRTIPTLGEPDGARVRDDVAGGMVTVIYSGGRVLLTQWRTAAVSARVAVVPVDGTAEDVVIGDSVSALWIEGAARGTLSLVGADGTRHGESLDVGSGVLLWERNGTALLLGGGTKGTALELAESVEP